MKAERPLTVVFFKTDTGNEPVREWLKALSKDECKVIGTDILTCNMLGQSENPWLTTWVTAFGKSVRDWTAALRGRCS